jgi:predicted amidophosphoribosyltransferase
MPTFKHPCPHCGTYIQRDAAACPACGRADPFAPGRCPACKAPIEDPAWVACPRCGASLVTAPAVSQPAADGRVTKPPGPAGLPSVAPADPPTSVAPDQPAADGARRCRGCLAPLPDGARFCRECGTVAAS